MTSEQIYAGLNEVFREVFGDDTSPVTPETTADDIEDWDSVRHINLLIAIEAHFGVRFTSREIEKLGKVGDIEKILAVRAR